MMTVMARGLDDLHSSLASWIKSRLADWPFFENRRRRRRRRRRVKRKRKGERE